MKRLPPCAASAPATTPVPLPTSGKNGEREVLVVLNLSRDAAPKVDILDDAVKGTFKDVFSGQTQDFSQGKTLGLKAWEYRVWER